MFLLSRTDLRGTSHCT